MKIVMKSLEDVNSENSFCEVDSFEYVNGSEQTLYFRLIQESARKCGDCNGCENLRYLPKSSPAPTLSIKFDSVEDEKVITKTATMAYPNDDRSIWKVTMIPADKIGGVVSATLTEGSKITQISLKGRFMVSTAGDDQIC